MAMAVYFIPVLIVSSPTTTFSLNAFVMNNMRQKMSCTLQLF
jgi:hypothetical protein